MYFECYLSYMYMYVYIYILFIFERNKIYAFTVTLEIAAF